MLKHNMMKGYTWWRTKLQEQLLHIYWFRATLSKLIWCTDNHFQHQKMETVRCECNGNKTTHKL